MMKNRAPIPGSFPSRQLLSPRPTGGPFLFPRRLSLGIGLLASAALAAGCGRPPRSELPSVVTKRAGTVLVDGCSLDAGQQSTLRALPTQQVVSQVTLLCLSMQDSGSIGLRHGTTQAALAATAVELHSQGYKLSLGITAVDAQDLPLTPQHLATLLAQPSWRTQTVSSLVSFTGVADSLTLAPPQLDNASRADLTALVKELSQRTRPAQKLALFAPPSVADPSDVPGGDAFDLRALSPLVDRISLMTLDFSCCGVPPGPTTDAAWAIDALQLAATKSAAAQLEVALPLYGTDFTLAHGSANSVAESSVTYDEATALAAEYQATPQRGSGDSLSFSYRDGKGSDHQVDYDDTRSTLQSLAAFTPAALPTSVGVVYYGLGAEDPTLWSALATAEK